MNNKPELQDLRKHSGYTPPTESEIQEVLGLIKKFETAKTGFEDIAKQKMYEKCDGVYDLYNSYNKDFEIKKMLEVNEVVYTHTKLLRFLSNQDNKNNELLLLISQRYNKEIMYDHVLRVNFLYDVIARDLKIESKFPSVSLLHDIGKLFIHHDLIGRKNKELNQEEILSVKKHAELGSMILERLEYPKEVYELALNHHRRLDGTGYPPNFDPANISKNSRLLSVIDTLDSMLYGRAYSGRHYHPLVIDLFLKIHSGIIPKPDISDKKNLEYILTENKIIKEKNLDNFKELLTEFGTEEKPMFDSEIVDAVSPRLKRFVN